MFCEVTGIKDLDNIITDYKECMEAYDAHKIKYKKVMNELKDKYIDKHYYIATSTEKYISAITLGWDCYDIIIFDPIFYKKA